MTEPGKRPRPRAGASNALLALAITFLGVIGALYAIALLPLFVLLTYLALSALNFAQHAIDKSAAQHGRWRTKESSLQLVSLLGGWPGAIVAQQLLRHKSRKRSFQVALRLAVVINVAALGGYTFLRHQVFLGIGS